MPKGIWTAKFQELFLSRRFQALIWIAGGWLWLGALIPLLGNRP